MFHYEASQYWMTRFVFQRSLGLIYLVAFLIAANQFRPLVGENGLMPARLFFKETTFWEAPSVFWWRHSDRAFAVVIWTGVMLSLLALTGISDRFGFTTSIAVWGGLWLGYLSLVNVGQTFYGFGWEMLLLETGFLAIFLGPGRSTPPEIIIWLLRWVLFRLMFGAGLIKIRGDECWRDLTCMIYHYETQPMPGPLSWYFHRLPSFAHRAGVAVTHFIELAVPFGFFAPRQIACAAGILTVAFQGSLILSGNLSWLNCITIVLCVSCFDDAFFSRLFAFVVPSSAVGTLSLTHKTLLGSLTLLVAYLSFAPVKNLFARGQLMNASFDPFHLVNTYGAFGSITRQRDEIIFEGTTDEELSDATVWVEYEFKGKPGAVDKRPPQVTPYHYKLDWQLWFAAMGPYYRNPWVLNFVGKLLAGDRDTLGLIAKNPFPNSPPKFIRAGLFRYRYSDGKTAGVWWEREPIGRFLPPLSLDNPSFRKVLQEFE